MVVVVIRVMMISIRVVRWVLRLSRRNSVLSSLVYSDSF